MTLGLEASLDRSPIVELASLQGNSKSQKFHLSPGTHGIDLADLELTTLGLKTCAATPGL